MSCNLQGLNFTWGRGLGKGFFRGGELDKSHKKMVLNQGA
jgi:hypothetical protein